MTNSNCPQLLSKHMARIGKFAKRRSAQQYKNRFLTWLLVMVRNEPHQDLSDKRRRILLSSWEVIYENIEVMYIVWEKSRQVDGSHWKIYREQELDSMRRFCESSSIKSLRSVIKDFYQFHIVFNEGKECGDDSQIEILNDYLALYKVIKSAMIVLRQILQETSAD